MAVCLGAVMAASCGPYTYTVSVDRRVPAAEISTVETVAADTLSVAKEDPAWKTINLMIYYYESENWIQALEYAYNFEWKKALDIWLLEADSLNSRKAYCAAHNISVACEVLEMNELAREWRERAEKLR